MVFLCRVRLKNKMVNVATASKSSLWYATAVINLKHEETAEHGPALINQTRLKYDV